MSFKFIFKKSTTSLYKLPISENIIDVVAKFYFLSVIWIALADTWGGFDFVIASLKTRNITSPFSILNVLGSTFLISISSPSFGHSFGSINVSLSTTAINSLLFTVSP